MLVNSAKLSDEYISAGEHVGVKCVVTDSYNSYSAYLEWHPDHIATYNAFTFLNCLYVRHFSVYRQVFVLDY